MLEFEHVSVRVLFVTDAARLEEHVSIKNDIKVVVIDKETTRWRALAACSAVIASLFLTLDNNECIDTREVL